MRENACGALRYLGVLGAILAPWRGRFVSVMNVHSSKGLIR
jgi:hypothetical protein